LQDVSLGMDSRMRNAVDSEREKEREVEIQYSREQRVYTCENTSTNKTYACKHLVAVA